MLILTRKAEQGIVVAGEVTIRVLAVEGERVKIGIDAPRSISILREELVDEVHGENQAAADGRNRAGLIRHLRVLDERRRAS